MTPADLRACLAVIGWTEREFARRSGYSAGGVRMWTTGRAVVPPAIAAWVRQVARAVERLPAPVRA